MEYKDFKENDLDEVYRDVKNNIKIKEGELKTIEDQLLKAIEEEKINEGEPDKAEENKKTDLELKERLDKEKATLEAKKATLEAEKAKLEEDKKLLDNTMRDNSFIVFDNEKGKVISQDKVKRYEDGKWHFIMAFLNGHKSRKFIYGSLYFRNQIHSNNYL